MSKKEPLFQIQFKDPDLIYEILNAQHPLPEDEDEITPKMEKAREAFSDKYFEYGDYGFLEINPRTLECRLIPRKEYRG